MGIHEPKLYPQECRIAGRTYNAPLLATICRSIDDGIVEKIKISLGDVPIMVKSSHCHIANMTKKELVDNHEDCNEFGGYFILNGLEKIIRMLIITKRNYPIAFNRPSYINRAPNFTGYL